MRLRPFRLSVIGLALLIAPRPTHAVCRTDNSDMSVFNMDVRLPLTLSNLPAVLAITADSASVWATPDVTPLPR